MPRRTSLKDAEHINDASDLEDIVSDKRQGWRANAATARRRQRRYKKRLVGALTNITQESDSDPDPDPDSEY
jgi:hypothetical protein